MRLVLTRAQMLERWMLLRGLGPMRNDAAVTRVDGLDLSARLELEMRRWYAGYLRHAAPALLPVRDVAASAVALPRGPGLWLGVELPRQVVRLVEVWLEGCDAPCRVVAPGSVEARREDNPLTRSRGRAPVAVFFPDVMRLDIALRRPAALEALKCVVDPGEEIYEFDDSLLPTPLEIQQLYDNQ